MNDHPHLTPGTCATCKADILWGVTANNRNCPYDVAEVAGDAPARVYVYQPDLIGVMRRTEHGHQSHFATCPNAGHHSKAGAGTSAAPK